MPSIPIEQMGVFIQIATPYEAAHNDNTTSTKPGSQRAEQRCSQAPSTVRLMDHDPKILDHILLAPTEFDKPSRPVMPNQFNKRRIPITRWRGQPEWLTVAVDDSVSVEARCRFDTAQEPSHSDHSVLRDAIIRNFIVPMGWAALMFGNGIRRCAPPGAHAGAPLQRAFVASLSHLHGCDEKFCIHAAPANSR